MRPISEISRMQRACDIAGQTKLFDNYAEAFAFAMALQWALGEVEIDTMDDAMEFAEEHNWQLPELT